MPLTVLFSKKGGLYKVNLTAHTLAEYNRVNVFYGEGRTVVLTHSKTGRKISGVVMARKMVGYAGGSKSTRLQLTLLPRNRR